MAMKLRWSNAKILEVTSLDVERLFTEKNLSMI